MKKTSDLYKKVITRLNKIPKSGTTKERAWVQKYLGSNKPTKCIKSNEMIKIARDIVKNENPDLKEFVSLIDSLYKNAKTFQEVDLAARFIGIAPNLRKKISPEKLDYWLNFTHGWAENDVLTQNNFTDEEILSNWTVWKKLLIKFSKDKNVHKRRASLVLLVKSVRLSPDTRLSDLAFKNIDLLKEEKDILITKAVSWILRSLIKNHKKEVSDYLNINRNVLPKIAVREVETKLLTGRKSKKIKK
jgi:3-methyladenine DNA glycosylase AlkD